MEVSVAIRLATSLMREHGLTEKGWRFQLDRAVRRFGCCMHYSKRISLSEPLTRLNCQSEVTNTILHEIAHALVGPRHGHDAVWKAKCREIGARPERCYSTKDVTAVPSKYIAKCICGKIHRRNKVPPKHISYSCKCQTHLRGKDKFILFYELNKAGI